MVVPSSHCCERVCFIRPRRSLLASLCWLDSETPDLVRRAGAGTAPAEGDHRTYPRRTEARRTMRMSFDINETVFDEQGTYLEEKAVPYEQALMGQFAASPEGQAIVQRGTELGWAGAMIHY